jgi:SAM-dependent methyltransferase
VSALPLTDGAADLTLAMHMLYHLPDPLLGVCELRRVTRPGGRVVVGLNGADHLRELRAILAAARGAPVAKAGERLRLDEGETMLRTIFSSVTRHDFVAELRLPGPEPVADYVRSMSQTLAHADPGRFVANVVLEAFPAGADGDLRVTTHSGCLICA